MISKGPSRYHLFSIVGILLSLAVLLAGDWPVGDQMQAADPAARTNLTGSSNPLQSSWEFAESIGAYRFSVDAQQSLRPRPDPQMIGQTSQTVKTYVDGEMVSPYEAHLTLRLEGAGIDPTPVALLQEGSRTFVLKDGEKISTQNPLSTLLPNGNYASYLAAAENVAPCEEGSLLPGSVACYIFDIDGKRFARFTRDQMQAMLNDNPDGLPRAWR